MLRAAIFVAVVDVLSGDLPAAQRYPTIAHAHDGLVAPAAPAERGVTVPAGAPSTATDPETGGRLRDTEEGCLPPAHPCCSSPVCAGGEGDCLLRYQHEAWNLSQRRRV